MQKQLKNYSPFEININPFGVQCYISKNGVLLSYALGSEDDIELCFPDLQTALNALNLEDINNISAFDLLNILTSTP